MVSKWRKRQVEAKQKANAERIFSEVFDEIFAYSDVLWLYTVRKATEENGDPYGAVRLIRLYWKGIKEFKRMVERYQYGNDDTHYFMMEQELKEIGVDVKALQAEAEIRYPNGVKREKKRWGEE